MVEVGAEDIPASTTVMGDMAIGPMGMAVIIPITDMAVITPITAATTGTSGGGSGQPC
jgi:hypothetical protein